MDPKPWALSFLSNVLNLRLSLWLDSKELRNYLHPINVNLHILLQNLVQFTVVPIILEDFWNLLWTNSNIYSFNKFNTFVISWVQFEFLYSSILSANKNLGCQYSFLWISDLLIESRIKLVPTLSKVFPKKNFSKCCKMFLNSALFFFTFFGLHCFYKVLLAKEIVCKFSNSV